MIKYGTNSTCRALTKHFDMHQNIMATNLLTSLLPTPFLITAHNTHPHPLALYSHAFVLYDNE